jgi:hypothetical protein
MRVFQTVISVEGFREFDTNVEKEQLLEKLAKLGAEAQCNILHLPAGFWIARNAAGLDNPIRAARIIARRYGLAIVGGIDIPGSEKTTARKQARGRSRFPFFGFAVDDFGRRYGENGQWRQVSSTSDNAADADAIDAGRRMFRVNDSRVAVLVCGEMHNPAIRTAIANEEPNLVLVSGHHGLGQGLIPTLKALHNATGVAVLHSQHLRGLGAKLHMVDARGISRLVLVRPNVKVLSPIWAAATIRQT